MTAPAFFWDLDGTLFDSYASIVDAMCRTYTDFGLACDRETVRRYSICCSVRELSAELAGQLGLDAETVYRRYRLHSEGSTDSITAMPNAPELLRLLWERGCAGFVYTHRGASALDVLERLGLLPYFTEILTAESGFPRKPDPTAIRWLLEKYGLDPRRTWYVGDRSLDIEAAVNAGIRSILFLSPDSPASPTGREDLVVHDLMEIAALVPSEEND